MGKKGFHFNQSLCSGCHSCMMVCKENHHLPEGAFFRRVSSFVSENGSKPGVFHLSLACNHCMDPACVANCPVGAMYVDEEDGTVQHDDSACIGCQSCVKACPYGAPQFVEAKTITEKCDMCAELQAHGEEPACVAICPQRALKIGDIDELRAEYGDVRDIQPLPDSAQTEPNVVIGAHRTGRGAADDDWRMLSLEQ